MIFKFEDYEQKLFSADNCVQNVRQKVNTSSKARQDKRTFISAFISFLIAIAKH